MVSCILLPALLSFQSGLAFFCCQPTAGKVLFLLLYCEPWQSCWFSLYANIYPDVQCEVAAEVCCLWCRLLPYPVTLVKNTCVHTWFVPLCSSWAKSSSHLCMPKEPKCSRELVSDFALKWVKIMHSIQSVSVTGLVTSGKGGTLDYSCLLELVGLFKELGKWERENHREWSSLGACQSCAVILGPWLLPVCLQCRARTLWARPKPLTLWDTWVLLMDWGDQSRYCVLWSVSLKRAE